MPDAFSWYTHALLLKDSGFSLNSCITVIQNLSYFSALIFGHGFYTRKKYVT